MKLAIRHIYVAVLFGGILTQGCVTIPTLGSPTIKDVHFSKTLIFDAETADRRAVDASMVSKAVAAAYPVESKYGSLKKWGSDPAYSTLSVRGVEHGPMTKMNSLGVRSSVTGDGVSIQYVRGVENSSGRGETVTSTILTVEPEVGQKGRFRVSSSRLSERVDISPGLAFMGIDPVASIEEIASDLIETLSALKPAIKLEHLVENEFDAKHSVPSVFANYERRLGKAQKLHSKGDGDSRDGRFQLQADSVSRHVDVVVSPYRNASRVSLRFVVLYELKEGGGSTFPKDRVQALSERLKRIAFD